MVEEESSEGIVAQGPVEPPGYRAMKLVVIGLAALIIVALGALAVGLLFKTRTPAQAAQPAAAATAPKAPFNINITMPPGAQVTEATVSGDRLLLHLRTNVGEAIVVLDAND